MSIRGLSLEEKQDCTMDFLEMLEANLSQEEARRVEFSQEETSDLEMSIAVEGVAHSMLAQAGEVMDICCEECLQSRSISPLFLESDVDQEVYFENDSPHYLEEMADNVFRVTEVAVPPLFPNFLEAEKG